MLYFVFSTATTINYFKVVHRFFLKTTEDWILAQQNYWKQAGLELCQAQVWLGVEVKLGLRLAKKMFERSFLIEALDVGETVPFLVLMILHPVVKTCFGLIGKGLRYYLDGR